METGNTTTEVSCNVEDLQQLGPDIYRVLLQPVSGIFPAYQAGQYLEILLTTEESCAFSIACAPKQHQTQLELHIQRMPASANSNQLFRELKSGAVRIRMPRGRCYLPYPFPDKPLLFIAAGTGFAQMKSMVELCLKHHHQPGVHLYWGARTPADFYLPSLPVQWSGRGLHYHPVVSEACEEDDWCGRHGLLYEAILADREKLQGAEIYLSGSPRMVYTTTDVLTEAGFPEKSLHSDVFDYSPRK